MKIDNETNLVLENFLIIGLFIVLGFLTIYFVFVINNGACR